MAKNIIGVVKKRVVKKKVKAPPVEEPDELTKELIEKTLATLRLAPNIKIVDMEETETLTPAQFADATSSWLSKTTSGQLYAVGVVMGCGIAQVTNFRQYLTNQEQGKKDFKTLIKKIEERTKSYPIRTLIATLGVRYFGVEPMMLELGFKLVDEYPNASHPGMVQRLYTYTWK